MIQGTIVRIVRSYGSSWGHIRPDATSRAVFFNRASLADGTGFAGLCEGQVVDFDEEADRANGTHAVGVTSSDRPVMTEAT